MTSVRSAGIRRMRALVALALLALMPARRLLAAGDPTLVGQWDPPRKWPAVAVHLVLMHTGKVLFFRGDTTVATSYVWDPATEAVRAIPTGVDIFCSAHSFLSDGRVLVTGGALPGGTSGSDHSDIFDPVTETWTRGPDMHRGRFYPTTVSTADGRVWVFGGKDASGKSNAEVEVFTEGAGPRGTDAYVPVPAASKAMALFPRMLLLDDGRMIHVGEEPTTDIFDPTTLAWQSIGSSHGGIRYEGSAVMLPPGHDRIMIMGGGSKSGAGTNSAEILDLSQPAPAWRATNPMHVQRMHVNNAILPDGTIYVAGGDSLTVELFDPTTESWSVMAPLATTRGYHSTAVLLPDGRVLEAGTNGNASREIFSPPYLFHGPRPVIDAAPRDLQHGQTFFLETAQADTIASVIFLRPGAYTHAANM